MPVIITAVGGVPDIFEDGKMGVLLSSSRKELVEDALIRLGKMNSEEFQQIRHFNREFSRARFLASKVSEQMVEIYEQTGA